MKKLLLILIFCSCNKDNNNNPGISTSGSISYKVNGSLVTMDNANILNGEGVAFAKQLKGSIIPNTRYLLNAQKGTNNFLGLTIVTDSLHQINYHYDSIATNGDITTYFFGLSYNAQLSYLFYNGDYFDINITSYKSSRISGTFSAKLSPGFNYNSRGSIVIAEGKLNNIPVTY